MEVLDKMSLIEWLANNYKTFGKWLEMYFLKPAVRKNKCNLCTASMSMIPVIVIFVQYQCLL